jgi:hypothetical protein
MASVGVRVQRTVRRDADACVGELRMKVVGSNVHQSLASGGNQASLQFGAPFARIVRRRAYVLKLHASPR